MTTTQFMLISRPGILQLYLLGVGSQCCSITSIRLKTVNKGLSGLGDPCCNPSTCKMEAEQSWLQGHPHLHIKLKASTGYYISRLPQMTNPKITKKKTKKDVGLFSNALPSWTYKGSKLSHLYKSHSPPNPRNWASWSWDLHRRMRNLEQPQQFYKQNWSIQHLLILYFLETCSNSSEEWGTGLNGIWINWIKGLKLSQI